jgi:hypothetical protein
MHEAANLKSGMGTLIRSTNYFGFYVVYVYYIIYIQEGGVERMAIHCSGRRASCQFF